MTDSLKINGKEYLSFATTRGYMRCTEGTLYHYIAQGRLKAEKIKRREYIELESLQDLMTQELAKR